MSVGTAFHPRTSELNTKMAWGEWSGYFAAAVYADFHDIEYNAIREQAALIDVSPLYKYVVSGSRRRPARRPGHDPRRLEAPGRPRLLHAVVRRGRQGRRRRHGHPPRRDEFFWTAADPTYRWFALNAAGLDVEIEDVSERIAGVALQGPRSRAILEAATRQEWADVRYFGHRRTEIGGVDVNVTRTGYTGDLGYEVWVAADAALEVWDALWSAGEPHGIRAAGIRALDVSRVEAGLILIEAEYTSARHAISQEQMYSPFEIGLGRLVDFGKPSFVGRHALELEQRAGGPPRRLAGLELDWTGIEAMYAKHDLPPMVSALVQRDARARLPRGRAGRPGDERRLGTDDQEDGRFRLAAARRSPGRGRGSRSSGASRASAGQVGATVVELPFLDLERKRA